jgi:hypothetical protein
MVAEEEKRQPKPKPTTPKEPDKKIDRVYYCPNQISQSFYIPTRTAEGKLVPSTDRQGQQKYVNGMPLFLDTLCRFETVSRGTKEKPGKTLCMYVLKANDPMYDDKFNALEKLKNDESTWVMDQAQYDAWRNKEAYGYKQENEALKSQLADKDNVIADMQKRIEELSKTPASGK